MQSTFNAPFQQPKQTRPPQYKKQSIPEFYKELDEFYLKQVAYKTIRPKEWEKLTKMMNRLETIKAKATLPLHIHQCQLRMIKISELKLKPIIDPQQKKKELLTKIAGHLEWCNKILTKFDKEQVLTNKQLNQLIRIKTFLERNSKLVSKQDLELIINATTRIDVALNKWTASAQQVHLGILGGNLNQMMPQNPNQMEQEPTEQKEDSDEEEQNTCIICLDQPRTHAAKPCFHFMYCEGCSKRLSNCAFCRQSVTSFQRLN